MTISQDTCHLALRPADSRVTTFFERTSASPQLLTDQLLNDFSQALVGKPEPGPARTDALPSADARGSQAQLAQVE